MRDAGQVDADLEIIAGLKRKRDTLQRMVEAHGRLLVTKNETIFRLADEIEVLRSRLAEAESRLVVLSQREMQVLALIDRLSGDGEVGSTLCLIRTLLTVEET